MRAGEATLAEIEMPQMPSALKAALEGRFDDVPWRWAAPGVGITRFRCRPMPREICVF